MNADAKPFVPIAAHSSTTISKERFPNQGHDSGGPEQRGNPDRRGGRQNRRRHRARHRGEGPANSEINKFPSKHVADDAGKRITSCRAGSTPSARQINITDHQRQHQQKQQRRGRKSKKDNNKNNSNNSNNDNNQQEPGIIAPSVSSERGVSCGGRHEARRNIIHGKHESKRGSQKTAGVDEKQPSTRSHNTTNTNNLDVESNSNECSFPTVAESPSSIPAADSGGADTSWNECLASKLVASSLESERRQRQRMQRERDDRSSALEYAPAVQLTMLSSGSTHATVDENAEGANETKEEEEKISFPAASSSSTAQSPATFQSCIPNKNNHQFTMIPNTKLKWTGSEISKMRQRWWDAVVRAKRKELANRSKEDEDDRCRLQDSDSSSSSSSSSSGRTNASSSSYSSDEESLVRHDAVCDDPTQPPSLNNTPFDEMDITYNAPAASKNLPPIVRPESPPEVPPPVLALEQWCIQSSHPLHCAIYNHSVKRRDRIGASNDYRDAGNSDDLQESEKLETEVVLHRLLTTQDPVDVMRWKRERVSSSEMQGLEANAHYQKSRAKAPVDGNDLSAGAASLTPLQLAIYWNLPRFVRLLLSAAPASRDDGKKAEEEDDRGRTPLMLACELGNAACIRAVLCASSPKLDRREREGGNTAFHFCCTTKKTNLLRSLSGDDNGEDGDVLLRFGTSACVESIDMLLKYTPLGKQQRRAFALTNRDGRNLLHLACSRGDLPLVECLLDRGDLPGTKLSKALDAEDRFGRTPFLAAVAADATDVVVHLLTTRFAASPDYSLWFSGCPLILAASKRSVRMTRLLLEIGYDASVPSRTTRNLSAIGTTARNEANCALLETVRRMAEEGEEICDRSADAHEIIRLLIARGGANPHLPVATRQRGKLSTLKGEMTQEDIPLLAAARAADTEAVQCMLNAHSSALGESATLRRNDPRLRSQPESYFRLLEEREYDAAYSSVDAALVASLFFLWREHNNLSHGKCALVLYKHRLTLSPPAVPQNLSQRAMQWLENCLSTCRLVPPPMLKNNSMEIYHFEAPLAQYRIPNDMVKSVNEDPYFMDWSYVLANLPWFRLRMNGVGCNWLRRVISDSSEEEQVHYNNALAEDEFFLVVGGEKLLAHKSIVSAKSGKLAAHIRFTKGQTRECPLGDRLSVHVDLPLLVAKILLCHCYHGSIAFGLMKSPMRQCRQLLEMALVAEEYLCPSLLLECEIRLLMQRSSPNCICLHCSSGAISFKGQIDCPIQLQCLEKAEKSLDDDSVLPYCEPVGVYAFKTSACVVLSGRSGLVTPESAIDVLAVAQQLEHSSSRQQGLHAMKYCRSGCVDNLNSTTTVPSFGGWSIDVDKDVGAGCIAVPFAAAKMMAIWIMLRDFPAVIRSNSYSRQIKTDNDENDIAEVDASFAIGARASNDEDAILLLRTCLEELACSPFNKK